MQEYVSLGGNCAVAYNLKKYNVSNNRLPFDWSSLYKFDNISGFLFIKLLKESSRLPPPNKLFFKSKYFFCI